MKIEWKTNKESLRDLWDTIKHTYICIMSVPIGEETNKEAEIFDEIILMAKLNLYIQKV